MSDLAIKVDGLGKQYKIGSTQKRYRTIRETLMDAVASPLRRFKGLVRGEAYGASGLNETIWALRSVSFEVKRGEVVGIIGRNGAGKSTLLKVLSQITEPTEGIVDLYGRVGSLLEVGTGFHPELTGRENVYLNGAILGMTRAEIDKKFDEIVDFAEIEKFIDTPVKHYSSGMGLRLGFAVAAHLEPEILVIDEVLAVGDAAFQKKCLGKMGNVSREGRTVLFVSHNMTAIEKLCMRTIWIDGGRIIDDGKSEHIISRYLQSASEEGNTRKKIWEEIHCAPGNDMVRLHKVVVEPEYSDKNDELRIDKEIQIRISFWVLQPDLNLNITLHLGTFEGITVLSTSTAHNPLLRENILVRCLYASVCKIPANFLNSGAYHLRLLIVRNEGEVVFSVNELVTFEVFDSPERRGGYLGKRPGVVAPTFEWSLKAVTKD